MAGTGEPLDRMANVFNNLWRAHRLTSTGSRFRCVQRRLCESLTTEQLTDDPLIQISM